ncbi:MAG TPA: radical SAM protein [Nannocystis exedens]|nr:radical SAM protein [Nannocystis exedens]
MAAGRTTMRPRLALQIAHIVAITEAEGPGRRFALWVQGCSLHCPGCCNPELFPAVGGQMLAVDDILSQLRQAAREHRVDGMTVVGGEPLEQLEALTALVVGTRSLGLGSIVFTGYTWNEATLRPGFARLQAALDTLVSGRFDARLREPPVGGRRFIGSTNQTLHHLSERYAAPELWRGAATMELNIGPSGEVEASGDPELQRRILLEMRRRESDFCE